MNTATAESATRDEELFVLRDDPRHLAEHRGDLVPPDGMPTFRTLCRWCSHGIGGVKLQARKYQARGWWTTRAAVRKFLDHLSGQS